MVTAVTRIQSIASPDGGSAPRDDLYSSEWDLDSPRDRSPVKTSSPIDGHRDKTTGTIWLLCTIWLCCSMEQPAGSSGRRGTAPPTKPGFSQCFFSPFCHRWSFGSLPLSPLACLVGDTYFPVILSTLLHRYYLNWTELSWTLTSLNSMMNYMYEFVQLHNGPPQLHIWVTILIHIWAYAECIKIHINSPPIQQNIK